MNKYFTTLTNERGDVLPNYRAQVVDNTGSTVTIYSDKSGTRFTDASGNNINYATADNRGRVSFYFTAATGQVLQTLDAAGSLVDSEPDFADNFILANLPGSIAQSAVTGLTTSLAAKADDAATTAALAAKVATADLASASGAAGVGLSQGGDVQNAVLWATPEMFGAVGDGVTDDTVAVQAAINAGVWVQMSKTYLVSASLTATSSLRMIFNSGAKIIANAGTYSTSYVLSVSGSATAISDLSASPAKGATSVTFATAPTLAFDDLLLIHNPTASSWSGFRTEYNAGEFAKVIALSGTTATLQSPLFDGYTAASVDVYKVNPVEVELINPCIESNGTPNGLILVEYGRGVKITNPRLKHANNSCIAINRCVDFEVQGGNVRNLGDGGDDYGLSIINSQGGVITGGAYYARRHGVASGGDSAVGNVPCREITYRDLTIRNDPASGTHSADIHGNAEFVRFLGCTIYGGVSPQGANITINDCDLVGGITAGPVVFASEVLGGVHAITNNRITAFIDPQSTSRGVVDYGGAGSAVTASTTRDLTVIFEGNTVNSTALGAGTNIVEVFNRGTAQKINVSAQENKLLVNDMGQVVYLAWASGTATSDFIIVDKNACPLSGKYSLFPDGIYSALSVLRLQATEWAEVVTLSTTAPTKAGTSKTFKWRFPRVPVVQASKSLNTYAGNRVGIVVANAVSTTAATLTIATDDATNFAAASNVTLNGLAAIREV